MSTPILRGLVDPNARGIDHFAHSCDFGFNFDRKLICMLPTVGYARLPEEFLLYIRRIEGAYDFLVQSMNNRPRGFGWCKYAEHGHRFIPGASPRLLMVGNPGKSMEGSALVTASPLIAPDFRCADTVPGVPMVICT